MVESLAVSWALIFFHLTLMHVSPRTGSIAGERETLSSSGLHQTRNQAEHWNGVETARGCYCPAGGFFQPLTSQGFAEASLGEEEGSRWEGMASVPPLA